MLTDSTHKKKKNLPFLVKGIYENMYPMALMVSKKFKDKTKLCSGPASRVHIGV